MATVFKLFWLDVGYEDHVPAGFRLGACQRAKPRRLPACLMMTCWTLDSSSFSIPWDPNNTAHLSTFWAFQMVAKLSYFLFSPFFLLSTKYFLAVFFLNVQLVRTEDLQRLQFLTKPALSIHNLIYSCLVLLLKRFNFRQVQPEGKKKLFDHV